MIGVRYLAGDYGTTTVVAMRDDKGRSLTWFASGRLDLDEGGKVTIDRATIKGLDEYRGTKQTVITRAKLTPAD